MSVRSFQQILDANQARKAAVRARLLAILAAGCAPDGAKLVPGACRYNVPDGGTCIVGALMTPEFRGELAANGMNAWGVARIGSGLLRPDAIGGLELREAGALQWAFDNSADLSDLRSTVDHLFPEAP